MQFASSAPEMERVHLDITVSPTTPPPSEPVVSDIPEKLLRVMGKYEYNWRIEQLAKPRVQVKKFEPKIFYGLSAVKTPPKLSDETKYYADQMSRPKLMNLYINRRLYGKVTKGSKKKFSKNINRAWDSIYNYYKKKERDRKLRQLRQKKKEKGKKRALDQNFYQNLAKPKPEFKPEPVKKPSKIFANYDRLDELASPKPSHEEPPKSLQVNPAALTYEPTENVLRLAKLPARFLNAEKPLVPGKVNRGALRYKITPRIEAIAQPKKINDKSKVDEDFNPWAISKNALKYKPTARILELAKPTERE